MTNKSNQPRVYDAVRGGQAPPPVEGVVLGGIEGVKSRLSSPVIASKVSALREALNYGEAGLNLIISALEDKIRLVQRSASLLLQDREEPQAKLALKQYNFWSSFQRLDGLPVGHTSIFANQEIITFDSNHITNPAGTAYFLGGMIISYRWLYEPDMIIADKLKILLQKCRASQIETLVFGMVSGSMVDALVAECEKLPNLKAVFLGDIADQECMISGITQSNVSPILGAYPNLEVLKVRASCPVSHNPFYAPDQLAFSPLRHNKLKALIIESGGLSRQVINQICRMELPALEYLELWLGRDEYGGTSSIEDVMPILSDDLFPKLKYLGLRNCEYTDDIAFAIVQYPIVEQLLELDLSMGTLGDEAAKALLNCPAIKQLEILDISKNYLSNEVIASLREQQSLLEKNDCDVHVQIIIDGQKGCPEIIEDEDGLHEYRYCSVAE